MHPPTTEGGGGVSTPSPEGVEPHVDIMTGKDISTLEGTETGRTEPPNSVVDLCHVLPVQSMFKCVEKSDCMSACLAHVQGYGTRRICLSVCQILQIRVHTILCLPQQS